MEFSGINGIEEVFIYSTWLKALDKLQSSAFCNILRMWKTGKELSEKTNGEET